MPRLFALNQNFPLPIVDSVHEWLAADADLVPIVDVHSGMATMEDWEVLLALHADKRAWGLRDPAELPASEGGWILLGKREQEEIALGLVGKFWRSVIEYVELGASGLKALAEPGYAKTVYGLAVSPIRRASNAAQGRDADRDH